MKLISRGFQMKDDNLSLERYHLYDSDEPWTSEIKPSSGLFRSSAPSRTRKPQRLVLVGSPDTMAHVSDKMSTKSAPPSSRGDRREPSVSSSKSAPTREREEPPEESQTVAQIDKIAGDALRAHLPTIQALEKGETTASRAVLTANEFLLQALLALDSVNVRPDFMQARQARKSAVNEINKALDRLDAAKSARL